MNTYVKLKTVLHIIDLVMSDCEIKHKGKAIRKRLKELPTEDVVSREVFEQVKWERDTALKTLEEHGIGLGQKADVEEVKHGEWINEGEYLYKCSLCGDKAFLRLGGKPCRYCPSCGAKMEGKGG